MSAPLPAIPQHKSRFVSLLVVGCAAVIVGCQIDKQLSGNLPIIAPESIISGEPVTVQVGPVQVVDGTRIGLVVVGMQGARTYSSSFESGIAEFNIPSDQTAQHGSLALIAAAESARGELSVQLRPYPLIRRVIKSAAIRKALISSFQHHKTR